MSRTVEEWLKAFKRLDGPEGLKYVDPQRAIADLILSDLGGYSYSPGNATDDITQLRNALRAYARLAQDRLSLSDLDKLREQFP